MSKKQNAKFPTIGKTVLVVLPGNESNKTYTGCFDYRGKWHVNGGIYEKITSWQYLPEDWIFPYQGDE